MQTNFIKKESIQVLFKSFQKYHNCVNRLKKYALTRMGHPYIGSVKGYFDEKKWHVNSSSTTKLVDNSVLGIVPDSIADTYINNSGSPYTKSNLIQRDVKDVELDAIKIVSEYLGYDHNAIRGYVTAGATEASLSCLWWLREGLKTSDDTAINIVTSDHSHYSIRKISNILGLKTNTVACDSSGEIDLAQLKQVLIDIVAREDNSRIILSLNIGTTELGGIDNIPAILVLLKKLKQVYSFEYRIHADAALLGLTLPILNQLTKKSIFEYVDTLIFSGHKLLGTLCISGIALAKQEVWQEAFKEHQLEVNYVSGIEDCTVTGSRSGYPVIEFHHALCSLDIDSNADKLKKMIYTCLENARYLAEKLQEIVGIDSVIHNPNQFTVAFPSIEINDITLRFLQKYGLMKVRGGRLGICVLAHVHRELIDKFLEEYKKYVKYEK